MGVSTPTPYASLREIEADATRNLDRATWDYVEGGANGEISLVANTEAFDEWQFLPRLLSSSARPELAVEYLGLRCAMPLFIGPFGFDRAYHRDGYAAVARAAKAAGIPSIVPDTSSQSLEEIAAASGQDRGFVHLSLHGPAEDLLAYANRAAAAGYRGIVFTDVPAVPWRERLFESRQDLIAMWGLGNFGEGLADPELLRETRTFRSPRWTWERLGDLAQALPLPFVMKGVLRGADAELAVGAGAAAIYVSNFGGRNLDTTTPPMTQLREVVAAVNGAVPVLVDSGVRRGVHVAKALALGATAVGIGRLAVRGLAAAGESGVAATLDLLQRELASTLSYLGCDSVADLSPELLRRSERAR
ncbi:alpha-hydroxy acid oxidase [Agromyces silvae]|uniref:alpha-hydroxy acid oxidase n=1 Tax=Agromyces silvae TaxID=3388266 RepID=UPI00280AD075|nr:alpha-hydroxy acid oxidase [Agromyces protaetiae]